MAYAALVSLAQLLDQIMDPKQQSFATHHEKQKLQSLHEKIIFLATFLDDFPRKGDKLEGRITVAANQAEDIFEYHILNKNGSENGKRRFKFLNFFLSSRTPIFSGHNLKKLCKKLRKPIKEIDSILKELTQIKSSCLSEDHVSSHVFASVSSSTAPTGKDAVVGLEEDLIEIKERLCGEPSKLQIIPITGMGGIGKTTLARYVFDDPLTLYHFDVCGWVTVSQNYSIHSILLDLLISIDASKEGHDTASLMQHVYQYLKGRRYLIVIDDVWNGNVWDDVRRVFPDDFNGSRIIITSRDLRVASYVDSSIDPHEMHLMGVNESWDLLKKKVFAEEYCPPELEETGKRIAEKCRGLPLALVVVGGVLSGVNPTKDTWKSIARNINEVINASDEPFEEMLSLSYTFLPHYLRPCFLYIGCFPEDHEIKASKLIRLWIAEGFLKSNESKDLEDVAEDYLEELFKRSLIFANKRKYDGKIKVVKIHDMLRDLCLRKARNERFFYIVDKSSGSSPKVLENSRRLSILSFSDDSLRMPPVVMERPLLMPPEIIGSSLQMSPEVMESSHRISREFRKSSLRMSLEENSRMSPEVMESSRRISPEFRESLLRVSLEENSRISPEVMETSFRMSPEVMESSHRISPEFRESLLRISLEENSRISPEVMESSLRMSPEVMESSHRISPKFRENSLRMSPKENSRMSPEVIESSLRMSPEVMESLFQMSLGENSRISPEVIESSLRMSPEVMECSHRISPEFRENSLRVSPEVMSRTLRTSLKGTWNSRGVSILSIWDGSPKLDGSCLHTIHLFYYHLSGWRNFRLLRVLNALTVHRTSYPEEIGELLLLRYLDIRFQMDFLKYNNDVPESWSKLEHLQTLVISHSTSRSTSRVMFGMWKWPRLRHLIMSYGSLLDPCDQILPLENLHTLTGLKCFSCSETMLKLIPNIKKLGIVYSFFDVFPTGWSKFSLNNLAHLHKLENLNLKSDSTGNLSHNIAFPVTLKKLTLWGTKIPWKDMSIIGSLPNLQALKLKCKACSGIEWNTTEGEFCQLKVLSIGDTDPDMWTTDSTHFPRLERLRLFGCQNLTEIPCSIGEITTLQLIEMRLCNSSITESAKRIAEEQQSFGNNLQVHLEKYSFRGITATSDRSSEEDNFWQSSRIIKKGTLGNTT